MEQQGEQKLCFGGSVRRYSHQSATLGCKMVFSVFLPPQALAGAKCPVIYWLSGLTCTDENFITKAGAQRCASKRGVVLICPDTSPRGCGIEGEDASWDFGTGAGFYVNATEEKWKNNYRMYDYVTMELRELVEKNLPIASDCRSIMGHSMGGHGALICALKNPGLYKSVSAFAPICNPINCPWGKKALSGYLGSEEASWKEWDATELVKSYSGPRLSILIDQGTADNFLTQNQLLPDNFKEATTEQTAALTLRMQDGYDHSYYFIATFIDDHINHHCNLLTE